MNNEKFRKSYLYKNYFTDFYSKQKAKIKEKIVWTIKLVETLQIVPEEYFKHLETTDGLYEIRVKQGSDIFRIFSFFDEGKLIVLANGFQKKTQKTPRQEIEKAEKIKAEYFAEKLTTKKSKNNEK
jgi:phage-related protein